MKTMEVRGYQTSLANWLAALTVMDVFLHAAFLVINMLLLMELYQLDPRIYLLAYLAPAVIISLLWITLHTYFVERWRPTEFGDESTRVSANELSKARSMQYASGALCVLTLCIGLVFMTKLHDHESLGDMHVVQNGIDTKSAVYTLWLVVLYTTTVGGMYVLSHSFYLFDTYLRGFKKSLKEKQ